MSQAHSIARQKSILVAARARARALPLLRPRPRSPQVPSRSTASSSYIHNPLCQSSHDLPPVVEAMIKVCDEVGGPPPPQPAAAPRRSKYARGPSQSISLAPPYQKKINTIAARAASAAAGRRRRRAGLRRRRQRLGAPGGRRARWAARCRGLHEPLPSRRGAPRRGARALRPRARRRRRRGGGLRGR